MALVVFMGCSPKEKLSGDEFKSANKPSALDADNVKSVDGFWVSEKYLLTLKTSKNPFSGNPESIEINTKEKKLKWTNFHEGYWRNIFEYGKENDSHFLKVSEPESSSTKSTTVYFTVKDDALTFNGSGIVEQLNERFIKIPSELPEYANKQILAGKYRDAEGKLYEFTENGNAIWPELAFDYELILDSTEASCPYINSSIKESDGYPKRFGYEWQSENLYIFEIVEAGDAPISCAKDAYLKLVRVFK